MIDDACPEALVQLRSTQIRPLQLAELHRIEFWRALEEVLEDVHEAPMPYFILDTEDTKSTWHPIERGQGGGGGY